MTAKQSAFTQAIARNRAPDIMDDHRLKLGKVIVTHPESHSVDVEFLEGGIIRNVQVLSGLAGTDFGYSDLGAEPKLVAKKVVANDGVQDTAKPSGERDIYAVVGKLEKYSCPIVLGFLFPEVSQALFRDGRMVYRHHSDAYMTIDKLAQTEFFHPSGLMIRVGKTPDHEDLTEKDFDKKWKLKNNTGQAENLYARVYHPGGVNVTIEPEGNLTIQIGEPDNETWTIKEVRHEIKAERQGNLTVTAKKGDVHLKVEGGSVIADIKNNLVAKVDGNATVEAGTTATIKAGATANVDAPSVVLAGGGPGVARLGDKVTVASPHGPLTGTITQASGKVTAG